MENGQGTRISVILPPSNSDTKEGSDSCGGMAYFRICHSGKLLSLLACKPNALDNFDPLHHLLHF